MTYNFPDLWLLFAATLNFFLSLLIYFKGRKANSNFFYALTVVTAALWTLFMLLFRNSTGGYESIYAYLLWASTVPIVYSFLSFSLNFPNNFVHPRKKLIYALISIPPILVLVFSVSYQGLYSAIGLFDGYKGFTFNLSAFIPYCLYIISYFGAGYVILLKKYRESVGVVKIQIFYAFLGSLISSAGGMVFGLVLPLIGEFRFYWLSPGLTIAVGGIFPYAIMRYRLLDIKLVLRKYSVILAALLSIILPALLLKFFAETYVREYANMIDLLILIIALAIFPTLRAYYFQTANKHFFSSLYDPSQVIAELSEKLKSTLEVERIYNFISQSFINSFHAKTVSILIYDEKHREYQLKYDIGHPPGGETRFSADKALYEEIIRANQPVFIDELTERNALYVHSFEVLKRYQIEVIMPLGVKDRPLGLIVLGPKESGETYNDEDVRVLSIIGAQAAIAIDNALLYEETRNFNIKLEHEVERATHELRDANQKLMRLDQAKSEFISIASHQLRTPLTVIKGYISMVMEGNFGAVPPAIGDPLDKVYESNERLIQLVENLLNISRIESGRLHFTFEERPLNDLVISVVEELRSVADKKGLKLELKIPGTPLPAVRFDEEKLRQVVINLIDNAIKYSKAGVIRVELRKDYDEVIFSVSDSGIGIDQAEVGNLFKKFSRGNGTPLINPGGSGLGLYVAKIMVEAQKGRIWVESPGLGKGSTFCFALPRVKNT